MPIQQEESSQNQEVPPISTRDHQQDNDRSPDQVQSSRQYQDQEQDKGNVGQGIHALSQDLVQANLLPKRISPTLKCINFDAILIP